MKKIIYMIMFVLLIANVFAISCHHADLNKDKVISNIDIMLFRIAVITRCQSTPHNKWCRGADINKDRQLNGFDLSLMRRCQLGLIK